MPLTDVNLLNGNGEGIENLIRKNAFRMIQFTGSSKIANRIAEISKGKVRIEDAGFD